MRTLQWALPFVSLVSICAAEKSSQILPSTFKPPQVFKNVDLVRTINLEKGYPRETVNVIIENVDKKPQSEYYLPFDGSIISRIGSLEAKDKNDAAKGTFGIEVVEFDSRSDTEYYRIQFPNPLAPGAKLTLSITYSVLSVLEPLPAQISQKDQQFLKYSFSAYLPSAYTSLKQKTRVRFGNGNISNYTVRPEKNAEGKEDPTRQGPSLSYGPYDDIPAGAYEPVSVRYEFTKPIIHATRLERDVEVSHWGGNVATEERYWLTNRGASLKDQFSRVQWQMSAYANPATSALKELKYPLAVGSADAYFTDDIGNVSTSRFRSNSREALLELKPRYPVFGGWNYSFKVGWNADLSKYLRKLKTGEGYALKVPFLEGPKMSEGVEYEKVVLRVILPEGAKNIKFETSVPFVESSVSNHLTYMDTLGRPALTITAFNLVDELRDREIVVTYDYPWTAGFRKPITIFAALVGVFATVYVLGSLDYSIGKKKN